MQYQVTYNENWKYIFVEIRGKLDTQILQHVAKDVSDLAESRKCNRVLTDLRQAVPAGGVVEIYNMPGTARQAGVLPWSRRALVVGDKTDDFHFLETVFINQGHIVKVFADFDEAQAWLCESEDEYYDWHKNKNRNQP